MLIASLNVLKLKYVLGLDKSLLYIPAFFIHPEEPSRCLPVDLSLSVGHSDLQQNKFVSSHLPLKRSHILNFLGFVQHQHLVKVDLDIAV